MNAVFIIVPYDGIMRTTEVFVEAKDGSIDNVFLNRSRSNGVGMVKAVYAQLDEVVLKFSRRGLTTAIPAEVDSLEHARQILVHGIDISASMRSVPDPVE